MGRGVVSARRVVAEWIEAFGMDARDAKRAKNLVRYLRDAVVELKLLIIATIFVKVTYSLTRRFLKIVSCAEVPPLLLRARRGVAAVRALPAGTKVEWLLRRRGKQDRRGISLTHQRPPGGGALCRNRVAGWRKVKYKGGGYPVYQLGFSGNRMTQTTHFFYLFQKPLL